MPIFGWWCQWVVLASDQSLGSPLRAAALNTANTFRSYSVTMIVIAFCRDQRSTIFFEGLSGAVSCRLNQNSVTRVTDQ